MFTFKIMTLILALVLLVVGSPIPIRRSLEGKQQWSDSTSTSTSLTDSSSTATSLTDASSTDTSLTITDFTGGTGYGLSACGITNVDTDMIAAINTSFFDHSIHHLSDLDCILDSQSGLALQIIYLTYQLDSFTDFDFDWLTP
ncbi:hypothetical protein BT96DRAFT_1004536 [Gymnopus androsaceus JB14]|uniref:Uncharacterized protein n=1 Tax=Gymnopus androsaceus JB14 TaxID=1447944 RepID=A0A6A4GQR2_9AGAR|nr:hypothetical protein BT96DRAFT_1004536 [Gymnopus androsaceus JB14]